jgi:hypothetical protein
MLKIDTMIKSDGKVLTFGSYWEHDEGITMTQPAITGVANSFLAGIGAVWAPVADTQFEIISVKATYMKGTEYADANSDAGTIPGTADGAGAGLADAMGDEIALVIQRRTGKRGRRYRGRMFIPGISENVNAHGFVEATYATQADNIAAFFGADHIITDGPATDTVWHARHYVVGPRDPEPPHAPLLAPEFIAITDCRWVNKLSTRQDRVISSAIIAR